jgi:arylsulfatase
MSAPDTDSSHVRPNFLVLMTDQQRWDALGVVSEYLQTPSMDWIANSGVRFANAYAQGAECVPSRVSLALSSYPHDHGVWNNERYALPRNSATWMRALQQDGYHTSVFGKTHLHPHTGDLRNRVGLVRSWGLDTVVELSGPRASRRCGSQLTEEWDKAGVLEAYRRDLGERYSSDKPWVVRPTTLPFELYPDVWIARQAIGHLESYAEDKPWMCWVGFPGPHEPWDTPEPYASRYRPEDMPLPIDAPARGQGPGDRPRGLVDRSLARRPERLDPADIAALRADYAGHVTLIDDQITDILAAIERRGELDRTVVVLISDHGELAGDHGLLYKSVFFGPAVRVPLMVRVPAGYRGATAGAVSTSVAELNDIGATLVDLAGIEGGFGSGKSLVPALEDPTSTHRSTALVEFKHEAMIATPEWLLAANVDGETYRLIDLVNDPQETQNLAGMDRVADIEQSLGEQLAARSPGFGPTPSSVAKLRFIHIGKTGGTALKAALRHSGARTSTPFGPLVLGRGHMVTFSTVGPNDHVMFVVRDPIARFLSGFYSRYRKGMPAHFFEWTPREAEAFARYSTPQDLASDLASRDGGRKRAASKAMRAIRHLTHISRFVGDVDFLEANAERIAYVGRLETLDADWPGVRSLLGLPDDLDLPRDPVKAHVGDVSVDRRLTAAQEKALREWYAEDYAILEWCDRFRQRKGWTS